MWGTDSLNITNGLGGGGGGGGGEGVDFCVPQNITQVYLLKFLH